MEPLTDWRQNYAEGDRQRLVSKITSVLTEALINQITPNELERLTTAAREFEATVFKTSTSKEEYARTIAERIVKIKQRAKSTTVGQTRQLFASDPSMQRPLSSPPISTGSSPTSPTSSDPYHPSAIRNSPHLILRPQSPLESPSDSPGVRRRLQKQVIQETEDVMGTLGSPTATSQPVSTSPTVVSPSYRPPTTSSIRANLSKNDLKSTSTLTFTSPPSKGSISTPTSPTSTTPVTSPLRRVASPPPSTTPSSTFNLKINLKESTLQKKPVYHSQNAFSESAIFVESPIRSNASPSARSSVESANPSASVPSGPSILINCRACGIQSNFQCGEDEPLTFLKRKIWAEIQRQKIELKKPYNDYIFRVDGDDYLFEEDARLATIPYLIFCKRNGLLPIFTLVERTQYKLALKEVGAIIGRPLCWAGEQGETDSFRKNMNRVRYSKYTHTGRVDKNVPPYLPSQFSVRLYLTSNIIKTINCEAKQTVSETWNLIFKNHVKRAEQELGKKIHPENYVMKFRGMEEYLLDEALPLISIETIRTRLRKKQKIEIILAEKETLPIKNWEKSTDYHEQNKIKIAHKSDSGSSDGADVLLQTEIPANIVSIWESDRLLRLKLNKLDVELFQVEELGFRPNSKPVVIFTTIEVFHIDQRIGERKQSEDVPYHGGNPPSWTAWIDLIPHKNLPWAGMLFIVVWVRLGKKSVPLGWVNFPLIDYLDKIKQGFVSLKLWKGTPNPRGSYFDNYVDAEPSRISFELEILPKPVYFPYLDPKKEPKPEFPSHYFPSSLEKEKIYYVMSRDPLYVPSPEEREILWKNRQFCLANPRSVVKFVWAIPWGKPDCVREAYRLLAHWPLLDDPAIALELLKPRWVDKKIREYTVKNLQMLNDAELADYLLQLVQALKHEIHHDSALARFLLQRALLNRNQIGHHFFWYMKSEPYLYEYSSRFELVLESYLKGCGNFREELLKQTSLTDSLTSIANNIKSTTSAPKRKQILTKDLTSLSLPAHFQIAIDPTLVAKGLKLEKCRYMESKTIPLWLVFENVEEIGDPILAIMKSGDDLRQDQLTLQMMKIMDKMWLKEGLDLKMITYHVISTGPNVGWIEVIQNAVTTADIQKKAGGVSEIFNEKLLSNWIRKHNPSDLEYGVAVDNFIRSCAGCCVATYLLGIGDRHNDNIMINKSGNLCHIDFGKFLGNAQMFLAFKRDRAPFIFTPDMAYVIGGIDTDKFRFFEDICCKAYNIVRKNASIFINLFAMMLSTGIPELRSEEDLNYIREAFDLDLSEEAAGRKFKRLINESLNAKSVQLNFAVHLMANPQ